eukprot:scaffold229_cov28-Tisochrysis_lutea.AAC.2
MAYLRCLVGRHDSIFALLESFPCRNQNLTIHKSSRKFSTRRRNLNIFSRCIQLRMDPVGLGLYNIHEEGCGLCPPVRRQFDKRQQSDELQHHEYLHRQRSKASKNPGGRRRAEFKSSCIFATFTAVSPAKIQFGQFTVENGFAQFRVHQIVLFAHPHGEIFPRIDPGTHMEMPIMGYACGAKTAVGTRGRAPSV